MSRLIDRTLTCSALALAVACAPTPDVTLGATDGGVDRGDGEVSEPAELAQGPLPGIDWLIDSQYDGNRSCNLACEQVEHCLQIGSFRRVERGQDQYAAIVRDCIAPRGVCQPDTFEQCIQARGGLACWSRWPGCRAPQPGRIPPVGAEPQRRCIRGGGGLSCFAR